MKKHLLSLDAKTTRAKKRAQRREAKKMKVKRGFWGWLIELLT